MAHAMAGLAGCIAGEILLHLVRLVAEMHVGKEILCQPHRRNYEPIGVRTSMGVLDLVTLRAAAIAAEELLHGVAGVAQPTIQRGCRAPLIPLGTIWQQPTHLDYSARGIYGF